ncbi:MAG: DNA polymerase III, subunit gamma and tau [Bacteroidales bacterium 36-12]|nr:MAG: DNA polymerase III, subunit gamma and tau [Bacteroidales bacterium 36-12]
MENFIVSARKYRPTTFDSVVGQSSLTKTLKNAIQNKQLAHAYLFCGPRGVGKTTCARIFAKTINCQNLSSEGEACNQCESCVSFNEQRSFNIHELDAASNNGVDDIRSLIDQVRIPPQIGKYSVYIIDEVHMLSQGAFNAFLKTLEEPPAHAIFILATTEKHKILPTILSRCQIYDFNRITVADTVNHLKYVAQKENVNIDDNALNIIAQKSDGGMRDALSIFDQLVSFCGDTINYQDVITNLNVLDYDFYFRLVDAFLRSDVSNALLIFNEVLNKGFDAHHFVTGLSTHFRDLLVCKDPQTVILMEVGADIGKKYQEQAKACPVDFLFMALKLNNDCDLNYRNSQNKRLLVELTLIRISQILIEKKNSITEKEHKPELKSIVQTTDKKDTTATLTSQTPAVANAGISTANQKQAVSGSVSQSETAKTNRPVSISISNILNRPSEQKKEEPIAVEPVITENELYTLDKLEQAWKNYSRNVPKKANIVSYINMNIPKQIAEHTYELTFSNVYQENDFKKELNNISNHIRNELKNSSITFVTKTIEVTEKRTKKNPEEIYKEMAEKNPALSLLKKNLNLEID